MPRQPRSPLGMDGSTSPDGGRLALLAAAENMTGLILDDHEIKAFIKKEESSPAPDDDDAVGFGRIPALKFKTAGGASSSRTSAGAGATRTSVSQQLHHHQGMKTGKGGKPPKISGRGPHPSPHAIIPRRAEDWDPWKSILYSLYITENRILRDIIEIMDQRYNLKATPKMYKNQFARWGFFKYSVKRRPPPKSSSASSSSPPTQEEFDGDATMLMRRDSDDLLSPTILYQSKGSRAVQSGLTAVRRFLEGHIDQDAANLQHEEVAGFIDPCYRYFKVAMDLFDLRENVEGGRVLRLAFLQIERKMSTPTMKTFSDLCVLIPHILLESGRKEVLGAYLQYLGRLATLKYGKHPVSEIAASFGELLGRPEDVMGYIKLLSKVHSDTISDMPGVLDRTRIWASNQHLACENSTDPPPWSLSRTARPAEEHHMIRLEAQSVFWAQSLIMMDPESDALAQQWLRKRFEPGFAEKTKGLLEKVKRRVAAGTLPAMFASMLEALFVGWLNDYYEMVGDLDKTFEWGRRGLTLSTPNEQYVLWSIHLENLMRRSGRDSEADELKAKRQSLEWMEEVRTQVESMNLGS